MRRQELHPRTEVLNKVQKIQSKKARNDALVWLTTTFPHAFDNRLRIRPLKIGIMADIITHAKEALASGISKSKLREAVVLYTRRLDYLACLKAREMRIDLYGNPTHQVTEDAAEKAALKIKKRVEKSTRNVRKNLSGKIHAGQFYRSAAPTPATMQTANAHPKSSIVVKHRSNRQFNPDVVARLKAKLGLPQKQREDEEVID